MLIIVYISILFYKIKISIANRLIISQLLSFGLDDKILSISSRSAEEYKFSIEDHYGELTSTTAATIQAGDRAEIVIDEHSEIGKQSFTK